MVDSGLADAFLNKLGIDIVDADFVDFVDSHSYVDNLVWFADDFGNARQHFAVVELYGDVYAEALKHVVDNLQQVNFVEQRVGADNVGVTLT